MTPTFCKAFLINKGRLGQTRVERSDVYSAGKDGQATRLRPGSNVVYELG